MSVLARFIGYMAVIVLLVGFTFGGIQVWMERKSR